MRYKILFLCFFICNQASFLSIYMARILIKQVYFVSEDDNGAEIEAEVDDIISEWMKSF